MNERELSQQCEDYRRIERAIGFIQANFRHQPSLDEIAFSVHLSPYHFHRLFKRWAGVSPAQFLQFLTLAYAKEKLAESRSLLHASLDAGLSGPGRLHDLFVTIEAMTPGDFKRLGAGLRIEYGFHPTPFGECLLATTNRGICHLGFVAGSERSAAWDQLRQRWPEAVLAEDRAAGAHIVNTIFTSPRTGGSTPFHLLLRGTNFQLNVWRALLTIPSGTVVCYEDVASYIGRPKAFRAVAGAIAVNPVGFLIPCHRVIAKTGTLHHYRWGIERKQAILGREAAGI